MTLIPNRLALLPAASMLHQPTEGIYSMAIFNKTAYSSKTLFLALDYDGVIHNNFAAPDNDHFQATPFDPVQFLKTVEADNARTRAKEASARPSESEKSREFTYRVGSLFDRMHHLEEVLLQLPHARLVITTAWRVALPLAVLSSFLSPLARQRVAGVIDWDARERDCDGVRGDLVQKWLDDHDLHAADWLAIDDQARHYVRHQEHLIKTRWSGMDESTVELAVTSARALEMRAAMTSGYTDLGGFFETGRSRHCDVSEHHHSTALESNITRMHETGEPEMA